MAFKRSYSLQSTNKKGTFLTQLVFFFAKIQNVLIPKGN